MTRPASPQRYVGRFAPSPTGPLHMGSVVAALASYLDARHHQGHWLLRIEDLDPPREDPESPAIILAQLRKLGLQWDGDVVYQSTRLREYDKTLALLNSRCYACTCTRKQVSHPYAGTCRGQRPENVTADYAIRFAHSGNVHHIEDRCLGHQRWSEADSGDFIVRRKDGLIAYQLAVVVDDIDAGVTHIVRGDDLLESTPWQLELYAALDHAAPTYLHIPVVRQVDGSKLSKQTGAPAVNTDTPMQVLREALSLLGQPEATLAETPAALLTAAARDWRPPQHLR